MRAIVVVGTDTGVGKTVASCGLARALAGRGLRVAWQKWVATGLADGATDLDLCRQLAPELLWAEPALHQPQVFSLPASPHLAAEVEGREVDPDAVLAACQRLAAQVDVLVVEGVGGVLVPLRRDLLLADFLAKTGLPAVVVARTGLGTINHSLLTLEALRQREIPVLGMILSDEGENVDERLAADNMAIVASLGRVEILARLPRLADLGDAPLFFAEAAGRLLGRF